MCCSLPPPLPPPSLLLLLRLPRVQRDAPLQIRFACYTMPDGTQIGDRANGELTKTVIEFGWKPPEPRGEFDVLPIVIESPGQGARVRDQPHLEVINFNSFLKWRNARPEQPVRMSTRACNHC